MLWIVSVSLFRWMLIVCCSSGLLLFGLVIGVYVMECLTSVTRPPPLLVSLSCRMVV